MGFDLERVFIKLTNTLSAPPIFKLEIKKKINTFL